MHHSLRTRLLGALSASALAFAPCYASVTVYSQQPLAGATTSTAPGATYTGPPAYSPVMLSAPNITANLTTQLAMPFQSTTQGVQNLSIPQSGAFMGFSIEFSVINQVIGINSTVLQPPFLNLMSNIIQRAGSVRVRVGGNTQDFATLVPSLPDGKIIEKDEQNLSGTTDTPPTDFTPDAIYMLGNVSNLLNVNWFLGIPLNDSTNIRLGIAELGEAVLGDRLMGMQVGNEPDLYAAHGHRPSTYGPFDYFGEFATVVEAIAADNNVPTRNNLIGPNVATGAWTPEMVWDTGFIGNYSNSLMALAVEHYPTDNCAAQFPTPGVAPADPQTVFPSYLTHVSGQSIVIAYINSANIAVAAGKPFYMMETNTASCGGFQGISNSFGSALWGLDYGMQMAYSNFSTALLHVGGKSVFYNPFTPPPTNESFYNSWTIGPIYFASLIMAEAFGTSNQSQIIDMFPGNETSSTPGYAIYDNGSPARAALFNYNTDPSGASDVTFNIAINGGSVPSSIKVKYLAASSVADQMSNITWAGQSFGGIFQSDGRLSGQLDIKTVQCDTSNNVCPVTVPAPGFALAFLTDGALSGADQQQTMTKTFSTSVFTKTDNTATVAPGVLETSNGSSGSSRKHLGSTSKGSSDARRTVSVGSATAAMTAIGALLGAWVVGRAWL